MIAAVPHGKCSGLRSVRLETGIDCWPVMSSACHCPPALSHFLLWLHLIGPLHRHHPPPHSASSSLLSEPPDPPTHPNLQPPLPPTSQIWTAAAGQQLPNVSINTLTEPIGTSDRVPAARPPPDNAVHSRRALLVMGWNPNGFQMSRRSGGDKWKWPVSAMKEPTGFSDWHLSTHANIMCPFKAVNGGKPLHSCSLVLVLIPARTPRSHTEPPGGIHSMQFSPLFPLDVHH